MHQQDSILIAEARNVSITFTGASVQIPLQKRNALDTRRFFSSLTYMQSHQIMIKLLHMKSTQAFPVLDVFLTSNRRQTQVFSLGSMSLYGIENASRKTQHTTGEGIDQVFILSSQELESLNLEERLVLKIVPRRNVLIGLDLEIGGVEVTIL